MVADSHGERKEAKVMPWLCLECDSKVEPSLVKPGIGWCPGCEKEVTTDDTYRVGKRFFGSGAGAMMAMIAAGAMITPGIRGMERATKPEAISTLQAVKKQRRKKVHGLRKKQRRHERQKRR